MGCPAVVCRYHGRYSREAKKQNVCGFHVAFDSCTRTSPYSLEASNFVARCRECPLHCEASPEQRSEQPGTLQLLQTRTQSTHGLVGWTSAALLHFCALAPACRELRFNCFEQYLDVQSKKAVAGVWQFLACAQTSCFAGIYLLVCFIRTYPQLHLNVCQLPFPSTRMSCMRGVLRSLPNFVDARDETYVGGNFCPGGPYFSQLGRGCCALLSRMVRVRSKHEIQ